MLERMARSPTWSGYARSRSVEWVLILLVVAVASVGALALAAAVAAGGGDRTREGTAAERAAIAAAGYSSRELHVLATLAAVARADLDAGEVEIVLTRARDDPDGVVVTGSRLPPGRLGQRVPFGDGIAGRGLAAGRTTLAGLGGPADAEPSEGLVAIAVPIEGPGGIAGVITATVANGERLFGAAHVRRLEVLAAEAGSRLSVRAADIRHIG
jgi:hypothetical protein